MPYFLIHNLARLTDFSGRDPRKRFWPYAGVVVGCGFVVLALAAGAAVTALFATGPLGPSPDPLPAVVAGIASMAIVVVAIVALLAAAVARRLHDGGLSARWGLLPLPFLACGLTMFPVMLGFVSRDADGLPNLALFFALFVNNLVYLAALVTLVILLTRGGSPAANRYGPSSAA